MKRSILFSIIAILTIVSCTNKQEYKLTGNLPNNDLDEKTVYLLNLKQEKVNSAKVVNKRFEFSGTVQDSSDFYFISIGEEYGAWVFFPEAGNTEWTLDSLFTPHMKGTPMNNDYQDFTDKINQMFENNQSDQVQEKIYNDIQARIQSPLGEYLFLDYYFYLKPEQVQELISMMTPKFKVTESVRNIEKATNAQLATAIGKPFVDIKGKDFNGKEVALSDYAGKGKIILIDFWASWCGPCIRSLPGLITIHQKYKDKGFEVVGVSLDDQKQAWESATKKHQIPWPQFSNLQGWKDEAAQAYGVYSIPHTVLIGKDGTILDKNLEGDELDRKLEELLK